MQSPLHVRARKLAMGVWLSRSATDRRRLPIVGNARARVKIGAGARTEINGRVHLGGNTTALGHVARGLSAAIELAPNARLVVNGTALLADGTILLVGPGATLTLGDKLIVDGDIRIICAESVTIGDGARLAWGVTIMDTDFHSVDGRSAHAPITIGDGAWIGVDAKIMKGVTIGEKAIVAAGSVVTADVPAGALVGGVPARVLREQVTFD